MTFSTTPAIASTSLSSFACAQTSVSWIFWKNIQLTEVWAQAKDDSEVEAMAGVVENVIKKTHVANIDYEVKAPIEILRNAERVQRQFNFVIGGISAFSLVVGGI